MSEEELISLAEQLAHDYIRFMFWETLSLLRHEMAGDGCGCRSCRTQITRDMTDWECMFLWKNWGDQGWFVDQQGNISWWGKPQNTQLLAGGDK